MTTKPAAPPLAAPVERFPEMPPRKDMQNFTYLNMPAHPGSIRRFLGNRERTLITGDTAVGWSVSRQRGILYPDLMVAFDVDLDAVTQQRGYGINYHGKPPDFVLEVASYRTARNDYGRKRRRYAEFGIPEYWRFDNTGGRFYPEPLAGDRLADGAYQPLTIIQTGADLYWGHSEVLKLDVCWEYGELRWFDPATQTYLLTHDEQADQLIVEREGRLTAEAQRDAEREARIAAQEARIAAEARIRQLEDELRRRPPNPAP